MALTQCPACNLNADPDWVRVSSVANPDPGLGAFLTPGSGNQDGRKSASGSGIRDEQPRSYVLELKNHFFAFFGVKILMEKSRIRDKHPGSATLRVGLSSHKKLSFYMKIKILKVGNRSKKHAYEGTKAFLRGMKPGLIVNFGQFPFSWIRIRIRIPNTEPDPRQPNECQSESESTTLL